MTTNIVLLPGDGIGPEVTAVAQAVLETVGNQFSLNLSIEAHDLGGVAVDRHGTPLPKDTAAACKRADAVFLGAVGGPKWANTPVELRPEQGLLGLRAALGVFANLRPVKVHAALTDLSPLRPERLAGVDLLVVRELTGGIYFGAKEEGNERAFDACEYTRQEVERVTRVACQLASERRGRLVSVDKANVLATSRLWRNSVSQVCREEFPNIELEHLLVDAAAMHLLSRPADFDVVLTENMFGDILTDEASMLAGSLGLLPSASLAGTNGAGLYEPIHGSAPDIAGKDVANPIGAVLSVAMMLRHSLSAPDAASAIEHAVIATLESGSRTRDLIDPSESSLGTEAFGRVIVERLLSGP
ncbi:MAG: 3-isopropylmalate dehydrogenase [Pseudomonadota bacterium]